MADPSSFQEELSASLNSNNEILQKENDFLKRSKTNRKVAGKRRTIFSDEESEDESYEKESQQASNFTTEVQPERDSSVLSISDEINIENKSSELHKAKDLHEMSDSSFGASEEAISNVERRRKKKNSSFYGELDDDDYALIEENLGDLSQPTLYKHRRLRRKAEEVDKELQEELKDLQDDLKSEASGSEEEDPLQDELYSEDDIQDFIVDRERSSEFRGVGGNQDLFVAEEIFGDVDELFEEEIIHDEKLEDSLTLAELFEPAVLKKERMAAEDSDIRLKDVPERLQLLGIDRVNPENVDEAELEQEAEWIYYNLLLNEYTPRGEKLYITRGSLPSIVKVLSHFRKDFLEVPFIRMYRKQSYVNHLTDRELWILLEWDAKWNCFNNMKNSLLELLEKLKESLLLETTKSTTSIELESDSKLEFVGVVRTLIKESRTALELSDLRAFFMHHFYKELLELDLIKNVSHRRKSFLGKEEGIDKLCNEFGLNVNQIAENFDKNIEVYSTQTPLETPYIVAEKYKSLLFSTPEAALLAARYILATDIANHYLVRKRMRKVYHLNALVSVWPTRRGQLHISEQHPCYSFRYLKEKPANSFHWRELLYLFHGEKEGLLHVNFDCESANQLEERSFFKHFFQYFSDKNDHRLEVKLWNEQRKAVLVKTFKEILFPLFEKELRQKLSGHAENCLLQVCAKKFRDSINMKPFFDEEMLKKGEGEVLTYYVMGITPGGFENPTMVALVDSSGQLVKSLTLRNFRSKILEEKQKDDEALKELIVDYQPKVIGIACEGKDSFHVYSDVEKVINEEDIPYRPGLEHVSGEVARLYMDSGSATEEFPNVPSRMRHAISVARRVANPLAEIANLTCVEDDLSMLKLHSEQRFLSNKKLNLRLAEELVDVVSSVGVRINEVLDHGNLESLVQYLPGFGPRKAKSFIEACRRRGQVLNRFELVTQFGMGPRVFTNVSAFLRFDLVDRNFGDGEVKVLDETRIHPESYELTKKIAQDVLDEFEDAENDECVETLLRDPQRSAKLDLLDLDKFANLLEKEGKGNNRLLLYDIKHELCFPFRDTRKSYSPLRSDERFELVTGQSVSSFESLSLVTARVTRVFPDFAYCRVDEVIDGRINRNNVSDSLIEKVTDHLQVGQTLQAVVLHTNIENIQLYLSCKRSDIESALRREVERKDHYFDTIKCKQDTEALQAAERKKLSLEQRNHRRVVNHPLFKNLNYQEAEEFLSPLEMGDCVIRPSCSKKNELALTWKVDEGVYQHISIEDFTVDKEAHSLEGKYKLKKQFYDDLDEILARFLSPITALLTEVQNSQCYHKPLYKAELDKVLREEKKRNPARIPYYLSASKEFAGKLMISYLPGCNTVIHEFVVLSPEGFTYRNNLFDCVKDVIDWFKEYQKKKIKELQYLQQVNQFQEKQKTSKRRESRRYSHRKSEGKVNESRRYRSSYEKYSKSRQISVPSHSGSYSRNKSYSDYRY